MIFDDYGLPKDNNATDWGDSARLAGIMRTFGFPGHERIDLGLYFMKVDRDVWMPVRHPMQAPWNNWKNCTRDQILCLASGWAIGPRDLYFGTVHDPDAFLWSLYCRIRGNGNKCFNTEKDHPGTRKIWPNGPDWMLPHDMNHLVICAGLPAKTEGYNWLRWAARLHAYVTPMKEPNQLLCMLWQAGPEFLNEWTSRNKKWKDCISQYWHNTKGDYDRGEQDLAEHMIEAVSMRLNVWGYKP